MTTYVAFLRAINLGATRKFPKGDIVAATEAAGFSGAATHINTGNVRFDTRLRSRARIETALEAAYLERAGFAVPTIAFTAAEVAAIAAEVDEIAAEHPLPDGGAHYVSLLKDEPTAEAARRMQDLGTDVDRALVRGRTVHLLVADPYHQARLTNAEVERLLGVATNRNATVIRAVARKWC